MKQYKRAAKEIEEEINTWYQRLAANGDVSMAEARKVLCRQWIKQHENASAKLSISNWNTDAAA